jgi:hypothetical protein
MGSSEPVRLGAALLNVGCAITASAQMHQRTGGEARASDALGKDDMLVLWLSAAELQDFSRKTRPPDHGHIVFSGELGGWTRSDLAAPRPDALSVRTRRPTVRRHCSDTNSGLSRDGLVPGPGLQRCRNSEIPTRPVR